MARAKGAAVCIDGERCDVFSVRNAEETEAEQALEPASELNVKNNGNRLLKRFWKGFIHF